MSDFFIIAAAKAKSGKEAELERALREVAAPTRAQPGCVEFRLLRLKGDGSTIIGLERWASEEDHQNHLRGGHFKTLAQRMGEIVAEPPSIVAYEVLDA